MTTAERFIDKRLREEQHPTHAAGRDVDVQRAGGGPGVDPPGHARPGSGAGRDEQRM
jgi:hypothetical protein